MVGHRGLKNQNMVGLTDGLEDGKRIDCWKDVLVAYEHIMTVYNSIEASIVR